MRIASFARPALRIRTTHPIPATLSGVRADYDCEQHTYTLDAVIWWDSLCLAVYTAAWIAFNGLFAMYAKMQLAYSRDVVEHAHPDDGWKTTVLVSTEERAAPTKRKRVQLQNRPTRVPFSYLFRRNDQVSAHRRNGATGAEVAKAANALL